MHGAGARSQVLGASASLALGSSQLLRLHRAEQQGLGKSTGGVKAQVNAITLCPRRMRGHFAGAASATTPESVLDHGPGTAGFTGKFRFRPGWSLAAFASLCQHLPFLCILLCPPPCSCHSARGADEPVGASRTQWEPPARPRQLTLLRRLEPFFFSLCGKGGCFLENECWPCFCPQTGSTGMLPVAHCNVCRQGWSSIFAICSFLQVSAEPQMPLHLYAR